MTDDVCEFELGKSGRREYFLLACFVTGFGLLGFFEVFEDWEEGVSLSHVILEGVMNCLALLVGTYLSIRILRSKRRSINELREKFIAARESAKIFEAQVSKFRGGISEAIFEQLKRWHLTPAEEEICLFLLKGFSLQEIANFRETSERTIRQQTLSLYRKSGLSGRAQLSAYFLEDLLDLSSVTPAPALVGAQSA